jgi:hypothetical protein
MTFLWSDAWLLQAIAIASQQGPASLADVIAAADAVNHALPTSDELHGGLLRLTGGGFVEEVEHQFKLTERVPRQVEQTIVTSGWKRGRDAASTLLGAEPWSEKTNTSDPRNRVTYPGLTDDRMRRAEQDYVRARRH